MPQPKISILMPVYNAERFLAAALDSILAQTFTDFELLILDDGSTDGSPELVRSYQDPRIRYFQNRGNLGISATLNKGIELAAAPLIARMDADDICYPERLQKQYNYMQQHQECALVACWVRVVNEQGEFVRQDDFKSQYYYYNLTFECWIYHPTILFRKEAVQAVGGYTTPYSEDFELFWQLSRIHKFYVLPEVLLDYRVTDQSLHQVLKKEEYHRTQQAQVLRNIRYFTQEETVVSEACLECLRHNFIPLLERGKLSEIKKCLQLLDTVSRHIIARENPNRAPLSIKKAATFKREFIISFYVQHLPRYKGILLLFSTNSWQLLIKRIKNIIRRTYVSRAVS